MTSNRLSVRGLLAVCALSILVVACHGTSGSDSSTAPTPSARLSISGAPGTSAMVGQAYSLQPTVSNASGTPMFSASGLPSWLTINTQTGLVSGTPTAGDVGTDGGITVTVTAGGASASLPTFSINVQAATAGSGSASLSWTLPTQNTDGTALTDLAGFRIMYGQSATALDQSVTINDPTSTSYTVGNLASGTWYFAIVALDSRGVASAPTNVATTTI